MYSHLSTYSSNTLREMDSKHSQEAIQKNHEYLGRTWEIVNEMPNIFSKYFDMTDYVKNSFSFEFDLAKKPKSSQTT